MEDVHHMGISAYEIGRQVGKALMEEAQNRGWDLSKTGADCLTFDELPTSKERTDGATSMMIEMGFPAENVYGAPTATRLHYRRRIRRYQYPCSLPIPM